MIPVASVHGRFQPFHNEHLEYVLAAKKRCRFLWIGITKPDVTPAESNLLGAHRELPENNPLTFFERTSMIRETLVEADVSTTEFSFVPFPIETPAHLPNYLPCSVPCFTTICEEWNRRKIRVLTDLGYNVEVLWEKSSKMITGSQIRQSIVDGRPDWLSMVPQAVAQAVIALDL
jgi:nicotinamide mononucleotide adenylyltransferase